MVKKIIGNSTERTNRNLIRGSGNMLWEVETGLNQPSSNTPLILGPNRNSTQEREVIGEIVQPKNTEFQHPRYQEGKLGLIGIDLDEARLYFDLDEGMGGYSLVRKAQYQNARKVPFIIGEIEKKLNKLDNLK